MVRAERRDRLSRECGSEVLHADFEEGGPCQPSGSDNGYSGEVRMLKRRRFEDSSEPRREPCPSGQEESESGDNDYETWLEIVEEIRID